MSRNAPEGFRVQGFDAASILSQIVALQSLHYLALSFITPVLLRLAASGPDLDREGGAYNVAMIVDWREFAGKNTVPSILDKDWLSPLFETGASVRSWTLAVSWLLTAALEILFLFYLVRKPTHILDFSLTTLFIHLVITTYYSGAIPTSLFWWFTLAVCAVGQVILAEQLCIRREMRDGLGLVWKTDEREDWHPPRLQRRASAPSLHLHHLRTATSPSDSTLPYTPGPSSAAA